MTAIKSKTMRIIDSYTADMLNASIAAVTPPKKILLISGKKNCCDEYSMMPIQYLRL